MTTALDPIANLTGAGVTEAGAKTWFTNMRAYLAGLFGTDGDIATARAALYVGNVRGVGRNIQARTNSGTPNTKLDITADEIVLTDASGAMLVASAVSGTIDFGVTGANGIDAGSQSSSTWYYGWVIGKADGTIAVLGSTSASAPTMPTGYTFKALVTAARSDGSTHFIPYRQRGRWCSFEGSQNVLSGGSSTSEAGLTITSAVPPIALEFRAFARVNAAFSVGGVGADTVNFRVVSGTNYVGQVVVFGVTSGEPAYSWSEITFPNVGQTLIYVLSRTSSGGTAPAVNVDIQGFSLPIGGE